MVNKTDSKKVKKGNIVLKTTINPKYFSFASKSNHCAS